MRASSSTRSTDHACQARRPCTGWCPGSSPSDSTRTVRSTRRASTATPTTLATGTHTSPAAKASPSESAPATAGSATAAPAPTASDGQERQGDGRGRVRGEPHRSVLGTLGRPGPPRRARGRGRGPRPRLPRRDRPEDRGPGGHLGPVAHVGAGQEGAAGTDAGVGTDPHRSDVQVSTVEPVSGQVDLGLDGAAVTEREQTRHGRDAVEVDVASDAASEEPGVDPDQRRRGQ